MTVEWLLRISDALHVPASAIVLELGGGPVDVTEAELLERWRRASPVNRQSVLNLLRTISPDVAARLEEPPAAPAQAPASPARRRAYTLHDNDDDTTTTIAPPRRRH